MPTTNLAVTLELTPRTLKTLEQCCSVRQADLADYVAASLTRFNALPLERTPSCRQMESALRHAALTRQPARPRTIVLRLERATLNKLCLRASRLMMPVHRYVLCAVLFELADDAQSLANQAGNESACASGMIALLPPANILPVSWELARSVL